MLSLLQEIQDTSVPTQELQNWIDLKKMTLCNAWTVNALNPKLGHRADRKYTAVIFCLLGSPLKGSTGKNINLLLARAFLYNGAQILHPGNLLDSTIDLIGERTARPPIEILKDCLRHYLNDMSSGILEHTRATQIERLHTLTSESQPPESQERNPSSNRKSIIYAKTIIEAIDNYLQNIDAQQ
jgi:hypothetical protein